MTAATEAGFAVLSIPAAALAQEGEERQRVRLRSELGIGSFGISAVRAVGAGTTVIREHDETGPGADRHEELYLVLTGHAVFTIAGEEVDAPQGTAVFVRDPELSRGATATEDGTIVVAIGARPGEAFRITPGEAMRDFFDPYNAKDYAGALAVAQRVLEAYPGNGLALYNIACLEALLGKSDDALAHLGEALQAAPSLRETAQSDEDFASLRGDERFEAVVSG